MVFLGRGELDVIDGAFVLVDTNGIRMQIPVGGLASLMLEPGSRVSHAAVTLASKVGCLLVFVGEGGVRLYSVGHPGGARSDRLLYQARLALDEQSRLKVVKKMFSLRFGEDFSDAYSVEQLRGLEGSVSGKGIVRLQGILVSSGMAGDMILIPGGVLISRIDVLVQQPLVYMGFVRLLFLLPGILLPSGSYIRESHFLLYMTLLTFSNLKRLSLQRLKRRH